MNNITQTTNMIVNIYNYNNNINLLEEDTLPPPTGLTRTHTARCPKCYTRTESSSPYLRDVYCESCLIETAYSIQRIYRKNVERTKIMTNVRNFNRRVLVSRVLVKKDINPFDLTSYIQEFLY
jgi:hypothetical protein